jgi:hypothetical protein
VDEDRMKSRESIPLERTPGRPYIEFGARLHTKRESFSRLSGCEPKGGRN